MTLMFPAQLQEPRRKKKCVCFELRTNDWWAVCSRLFYAKKLATTHRKLRTAAQSTVQSYCGQWFVDNVIRYAKHPFSINLGTNAKHTDCIENTRHTANM